MHSRARASGASAARFDKPARQATEPRAKREAMSALCHGLVVDSTFERSENVAIKGTVSGYKGRVLLFLETFEINRTT